MKYLLMCLLLVGKIRPIYNLQVTHSNSKIQKVVL